MLKIFKLFHAIICIKAHEEEEKGNEIAFINQLEQQNRRCELIEKINAQDMKIKQLEHEKELQREQKIVNESRIAEVWKF